MTVKAVRRLSPGEEGLGTKREEFDLPRFSPPVIIGFSSGLSLKTTASRGTHEFTSST